MADDLHVTMDVAEKGQTKKRDTHDNGNQNETTLYSWMTAEKASYRTIGFRRYFHGTPPRK